MTTVKMVINPEALLDAEREIREHVIHLNDALRKANINLERVESLVETFPADETLGQVESRLHATKRRHLDTLNELLVPAPTKKKKRKYTRKYTKSPRVLTKPAVKKAAKKRPTKKAKKNATKKS